MADNTVSTQFTADPSNAIAGAEQAAQAAENAAKRMQDASERSFAPASQGQPGGITSAIGRQTVAQKEAAAAAARTAAEYEKLRKKVVETGDAADNTSAVTVGGLKSALSSVRSLGSSILAAVAAGVGLSKLLDAWFYRAEDVNRQLREMTRGVREFGDGSLFSARTAGLEATAAQIASLRRDAQREVEALVAEVEKSATNIKERLLGSLGLAPSIAEQRKAVVDAVEQLNRQVNAAAELIEKNAAKKRAEDTAKEREKAEKESNERSASESRRARDEADRIAANAIEDEKERLKALARLDQQATDERLRNAKTAEERSAIFALGEAQFAAYMAKLKRISEEAAKERADAEIAHVKRVQNAYTELADAIEAAYDRQVQASQNASSGLAGDIKSIAEFMRRNGSWAKGGRG